MSTKVALETGKLYQVKHWEKGWIIAEYVAEVAAHSYKYNNLHMDTLTIGPEKTRHVPLSHRWKQVRSISDSAAYTSTFTVEDRKMEVREITQEAIETIARLRDEIATLEQQRTAKRKELREFCE